MRIFRLPASLPAHLNAKRFPWQCFRCQPVFSNPAVFYSRPLSPRRPALLPAPRPAPACLFPFLVSSYVPSGVLHPARLPASLPVQHCRPSSRSRYHRPACRVVESRSWAKRAVAIRCVCRSFPVSVAFPRQVKLALSIVSSCGKAGGEDVSLAHAVYMFVRFPCSEAICIYPFRKSPNI